MDLQSLIEFAVYLSTLVLIFYIKPFWSETAKKFVEKNSIEIITKISEGIKAEIAQETEKLKNYLNYTSQHNLNLLIDEKEALYEFNTSIYRTLKIVDLYSTDFYNAIQNYEQSNSEINTQFLNYTEKLSHLFLFIRDDEKLMSLLREYSLELHTLKTISNKFILDNFYVKQIRTANEENYTYFSEKYIELTNITDDKYILLTNKQDLIRDKIYLRLTSMNKRFQNI